MQDVKQQFEGLLDNFRSFDKVLQSSQIKNSQSRPCSSIERVTDARQRIRSIYASKRTTDQLKCAMKENYVNESVLHHFTFKKNINNFKKKILFEENIINDTSIWSNSDSSCLSVSPGTINSKKINIHEISIISKEINLREYASSSSISGICDSTFNHHLHSTLNYPLHSTILEEQSSISDNIHPRVAQVVSITNTNMYREQNIRNDVCECQYATRSRSLRRQTAQIKLDKLTSSMNNQDTIQDSTTNATCHSSVQLSPYQLSNRGYYNENIPNRYRSISNQTRNKMYYENEEELPKLQVPKRRKATKRSIDIPTNSLASDMSSDKEHKLLKASVKRRFRDFKRSSSEDTIHTLAHF